MVEINTGHLGEANTWLEALEVLTDRINDASASIAHSFTPHALTNDLVQRLVDRDAMKSEISDNPDLTDTERARLEAASDDTIDAASHPDSAERDGDRWADIAEVGGADRDVNGVARARSLRSSLRPCSQTRRTVRRGRSLSGGRSRGRGTSRDRHGVALSQSTGLLRTVMPTSKERSADNLALGGSTRVHWVVLTDVKPLTLRSSVTTVYREREVCCFASTVAEKVRSHRPGARLAEVRAALQAVAADWVDDSPDGVDTVAEGELSVVGVTDTAVMRRRFGHGV